MNWFKDNPFLAGLAAVTLVASLALGYLAFQSYTAYSASIEGYTAAVSKLHGLQNKVPFPSAENLATMKSGLDDYAARINTLRSQLTKMEVPLNEKITAQQFQDGLRTAVNDLRVKAEANGVQLPEKFYFGFDQYQTQVPSEQAAPFLQRQFLVIQAIITRLVDFRVASIEGVNRPPLAQEGPAAAAPAPAPGKAPAEPVLVRFPFDVSFTAEQGKFRVAFNSLLGSDQFLIIRSIDILNSNPLAPSKSASAATPSAADTNPFAAQTTAKDQKSLQVILGRELLKVNVHLEMLDFSEPPAAKK